MAADFAALHTALGLKPALVMGHSFGITVALPLAARRLSRTDAGLYLPNPFIPALHHLQANPRKWKGFRYRKNAATAGMIIAGNLWDLSEMLQQAANLSPRKKKMFIERAGEATLNRLVRLARCPPAAATWPKSLASPRRASPALRPPAYVCMASTLLSCRCVSN